MRSILICSDTGSGVDSQSGAQKPNDSLVKLLDNRHQIPSSGGEAVVAVWMEAEERGHAVNTAQQHGQQAPL